MLETQQNQNRDPIILCSSEFLFHQTSGQKQEQVISNHQLSFSFFMSLKSFLNNKLRFTSSGLLTRTKPSVFTVFTRFPFWVLLPFF